MGDKPAWRPAPNLLINWVNSFPFAAEINNGQLVTPRKLVRYLSPRKFPPPEILQGFRAALGSLFDRSCYAINLRGVGEVSLFRSLNMQKLSRLISYDPNVLFLLKPNAFGSPSLLIAQVSLCRDARSLLPQFAGFSFIFCGIDTEGCFELSCVAKGARESLTVLSFTSLVLDFIFIIILLSYINLCFILYFIYKIYVFYSIFYSVLFAD